MCCTVCIYRSVCVLVFGESVDVAVIVGSSIVVGAGLYSWTRERKLALAQA